MRKDGEDLVNTAEGVNIHHAQHSSSSSVKTYQVWKGNNQFCFNGRLMYGPDGKTLILTTSLIVAPVILFCAFVSGGLVRMCSQRIGDWIVAVVVVWTVYVVSLLFITASRDPGIVPRSLHHPEPEDDGHPGRQNAPPTVSPKKDLMVNGSIVKVPSLPTGQPDLIYKLWPLSSEGKMVQQEADKRSEGLGT